jgi:chemotaxis protein histidine kinase CheA
MDRLSKKKKRGGKKSEVSVPVADNKDIQPSDTDFIPEQTSSNIVSDCAVDSVEDATIEESSGDEEAVPTTEETIPTPAVEDDQPPVEPPAVEEEPPAASTTTVEEEAPAVEEEPPAVEEEPPAASTTTVEEEAPAVEEEAPAVEEEAPAVEEEAPAVEEEAPVVATVVEEEPPAVEEEPPAVEEEPPAVEEEPPAVEEEPPAVEEEQPVETEEAETPAPEEPQDLYKCYPKDDPEEESNPALSKMKSETTQTQQTITQISYMISETPDEIPASSEQIPKLVFIIPYRDRKEQYEEFIKNMKVILDNMPPPNYRMFFIHQCDERPFNRGALKNIGFLVVKEKYPDNYKDITLVFNDVDTYPSEPGVIQSYETVKGTVKHFYGYKYALGGIVSINAEDFETTNGFPNYWAWGYEDNMLAKRVEKLGLTIDRSNFYAISDKKITQIKTEVTRVVNRGEFERYIRICNEGINSIGNLKYTIHEDNGFVDVTKFDTEFVCKKELDRVHDIRNGNRPFTIGYSSARRAKLNLVL